MMIEIAQSLFARILLYLIGISLAVSLIATVSCEGPIDQIFIGWRDKASCAFRSTCIVGENSTENTAVGAAVLAVFLIVVAFIYGCIFYIKKFFKT